MMSDADAMKAVDTTIPHNPVRAEHIDLWLQKDRVLVAEVTGKVVGYGVFNHSFFHQSSVEILMVHPEHRGAGVGYLLLGSLEPFCDTPRLWITTNRSNQPMQELLASGGYHPSGYTDGLDPGDPEIIYSKRIHNES